MAGRGITYNGNSLQTPYILSQDFDMETPSKDTKLYAIDHANKSVIPYASYPNRTIKITGELIGDTIADLDSRIDAFKAFFNGQDQNLDIDYAGSTRRFIATLNSAPAITRPGGLTFASFALEFICTSPFGRATASTTLLSATGRTASSYADTLTFAGTAPYQQPVITVTYTTISTPTTTSVVISNNSNGQNVTITRTWTSGDILQVDCFNKVITVNGNIVGFFGAYPEFPPGSGVLAYSDGLASRTFNVNVAYIPQYL